MLKFYLSLLIVFSVAFLTIQQSKRPNPANVAQINAVYNKPWYSGYLDIQDQNDANIMHHMHYFFFPSQSDSTSDPVLFWFNGGPGCSSLLGALYEHGPFLVNDAFGFLMNNKFSWNKKASVVYIESPSLVGFSYMDNAPKKYVWNDELVAVLNKLSVIEFFNVWKEYAKLDVYIAGQSYGGIYVPTLFEKLHDYNKNEVGDDRKINIKGFAVGNGCTHATQCEFLSDYSPYLMQLYLDYGFITQDMYNEIRSKCENKTNPLPDDCQALMDKTDQMMDGINIYDAYRPCYQNNNASTTTSFKELRRLAMRKRTKEGDKLSWAPPCVDSKGIDNILLSAEVRANLSIPEKVAAYSMCNADEDVFFYDRSLNGSYHVYEKLLPLNQYKILIYSGDSDPAVPTSGTLYWITKLREQFKLPTKTYWRPWTTNLSGIGPQNGGNVWELDKNFKLVTFKGIGHMAPQWNIEGGQKVIYNLIWGTEL